MERFILFDKSLVGVPEAQFSIEHHDDQLFGRLVIRQKIYWRRLILVKDIEVLMRSYLLSSSLARGLLRSSLSSARIDHIGPTRLSVLRLLHIVERIVIEYLSVGLNLQFRVLITLPAHNLVILELRS